MWNSSRLSWCTLGRKPTGAYCTWSSAIFGCLNAAGTDFIFSPTLNNICGRPILVIESNNPDPLAVTSVFQKSTIGEFVRLRNSEYDDVSCGLTAAHAFEDELRAFPASTDVEFAFDGSDGKVMRMMSSRKRRRVLIFVQPQVRYFTISQMRSCH